MPLTKDQIIEIQAAAKYNTTKRIRDNEAEKQYKEELAEQLAANKKPKATVKPVSDK